MTDNLIEIDDAKLISIALVKAAYDDCADFCERLSQNADDGMPALDAQSRKLAEIILQQVSEALRAKCCQFEREFFSPTGAALQ